MLDYGYNFMNTKIFIDSESIICIVKNLVFHSMTKHIEIRHHFIRDSYKKKLIQMIKIHTDLNVADLLTKAFDVGRFQYLIFWQTATASTLDNGEMEITATIDGKVKVVSEASIKRHLKLKDSDGISTLPNTEIFEQLALMGYAASTSMDDRIGGVATTVTGLEVEQGSGNIRKTPSMPQDSPLPRVNTLGSDEGSMKLQELMKVKKLEKTVKSSQARRRAKIVVSDDEEDLEDPSKQGRMISAIDQDPIISLVQHDAKIKGRQKHEMEFEFDHEEVSTVEEVSTASLEVKIASDSVDDIAAKNLVYTRRSVAKTKDKGKGIMEESESTVTKKKRQQEQERLGLETAMRLQEEFDEEERQRIARVHESASSFNIEEWEDIQARVQADEEFAQKYFAAQRAEERRNKSPTQAQERTYMSNYIKHMGSHTLQQLKRYSFDEIKALFETTMRRVSTFVLIESEDDKAVPELAAGSLKRPTEEELDQETSKRQKTRESSESRDKEVNELSQEELQQLMIIVLEEGMNIEALQTKYPIIDSEVYSEDSRMFNSTEPTEDKEIEIWVELKRLFEPDIDDELWKCQKYIHDITWRLYDTCGVHHVSTKDGVDIYMLVEREYPLSRGVLTQMLIAKLLVEQNNEMSRELLRKIFMQVERPRR
ncbi:hypothetical protein Tco_0784637 [Tanacetum coccineum]